MKERPYFYNLVLGSFYEAIQEGNVEKIMLHAKKVKKYVIDNDIKYACNKVIGLYEAGKEFILTEEIITYLKYEIEVLQFYEYVEAAVKNMCSCASFFAKVGAFQSAYRILYDANIYAVRKDSVAAIVMTLETQGEVCICEGDYTSALSEMRKALHILKLVCAEIPINLRANMALAEYRTGNYDKAGKIYECILKKCEEKNFEWWQIKFSKILCDLRLNKDIDVICQELKELEEKIELVTSEEVVEFCLISAEVFLGIDEKETVLYLQQAVDLIEKIINENVRLHYRRGVREKYVARIKRILENMKNMSQLQEELVTVLVFLKINMMAEWLALKEFINNAKFFYADEKVKAENIIKRMESEGVPILYGFNEKYDDPFEEYGPLKEMDSINKMWNDFAEFLSRNDITVENLYEGVSSKAITKRILNSKKDIYVFIECCQQGAMLWFNSENIEEKIVWDIECLCEYIEKYVLFQRKEISRMEFGKVIEENIKRLKNSLQPIFNQVEMFDEVKIHFIADYLTSSFPFLCIFLENDNIKEKIDKNKFEFVVTPILYKSNKVKRKYLDIEFVEYNEENLSFQEAEFEALSSKFRANRWQCRDWIEKKKHDEVIIHISSHGLPIERYTDPVFADIRSDENGMSIGLLDIQHIAANAHYEFVCINCCYGGEFSNHNFFHVFKTNELIGYNTAFMLNGKSAVLAPKWPVMDLVALFFTELLYRNLLTVLDYSKAYIKTIHQLYNLDIVECKDIANKISNDEPRKKALSMLERCPVQYPFQNIVDVGVYNFLELL